MSNRTKKKHRRKQIIYLVIFAVLCAFAFQTALAWIERGKLEAVSFTNPSGKTTASFYLEVADTDSKRAKGLMFKKDDDLKPNEGMLFIFPDEVDQSFWMKNTYLSLDIIFVGSDLEVKGILENVPILTTQQRSIGVPSKYVIELLAGMTSKHDITKGSRVNSKFLESLS
ncbi:MAG: DUF192 domain-containing protein [Bdellovibrionota bacterium]